MRDHVISLLFAIVLHIGLLAILLWFSHQPERRVIEIDSEAEFITPELIDETELAERLQPTASLIPPQPTGDPQRFDTEPPQLATERLLQQPSTPILKAQLAQLEPTNRQTEAAIAERQRQAEQKRKEEERQRLAEEQQKEAERKRLAEEQQQAAERKRLAEAQQEEAERKRLAEAQQEEAERKRLAEAQQEEAERKRLAEEKRKEAEERKRLAEAQRKEAERKRLAEEKRKEEERKRIAEAKRKEEERKRQAAAEAARKQQEAAAAAAAAARQAAEAERLKQRMQQVILLIQQKVQLFWRRPANTPSNLSCVIEVRLLPDGAVGSAIVVISSGNIAFDRMAEQAVLAASPLPVSLSQNADVFDQFRHFRFRFSPN